MKLEELIYKRFTDCNELTDKLAKFLNFPAIFSPEPPRTTQEEWGGNPQYPRVVYSYDLQANEERHSAGTLSVSLLCQNTTDIVPEDIEPIVKDCLRDVVMKTDGGTMYCFAWSRTDPFTMDDKKDEFAIGSDVRFDILEYTLQETTDPDPVVALNRFLKKNFPELVVLWNDSTDDIIEATKENPIAYVRLVGIRLNRETNTVAWMDGEMAVHFLCPDSDTRMKLVLAVSNILALHGEVIMLDNSPMFIKQLSGKPTSDYLTQGQLKLNVQYGILRTKAITPVLTDIKI
jgi:hypothetical protein